MKCHFFLEAFIAGLLTSLASAVRQVQTAASAGCDGGSSDHKMLAQIEDSNVPMVAKVIATETGGRMLVIGSKGDLSEPCSDLTWWLKHEVQGSVACEVAPAHSFLQLRASEPAEVCSPCTARVDDVVSGNGYLRSMAALSVLTPTGQTRSPGRVLVVGLGAGVLPSWLVHRTDAIVDVVDISEAVVRLSECFGLQQGPRMALHVADGRAFLQSAKDASYDTLVVDAFDKAASMPASFRTVEFFQLVASKLTPGGLLLLNLLTCNGDADPGSCGSFAKSLVASVQVAFPDTYLAQAPGAFGSQAVLIAKRSGGTEDGASVKSEVDLKQLMPWFKDSDVEKLGLRNASLALHDQN